MKMYFYIQLDWGEDFVGIFFWGEILYFTVYTQVIIFLKGNPSHI